MIMVRELPRTLCSLTRDYQRHCTGIDYEVLVVDNGSPEPFGHETEPGWVKVNDRGLSQRLQTEEASVQRSEVGVARSVLCPASPGAAAGHVATARALVAIHDDDGVWMRADQRRRERRRPSRTVQDGRLRYPQATPVGKRTETATLTATGGVT